MLAFVVNVNIYKISESSVALAELKEKLTWLEYFLYAMAGRTTTVLCLNCRGKMEKIKIFAVPKHYSRTLTDGSKCSSQNQLSSFSWTPFNNSYCAMHLDWISILLSVRWHLNDALMGKIIFGIMDFLIFVD